MAAICDKKLMRKIVDKFIYKLQSSNDVKVDRGVHLYNIKYGKYELSVWEETEYSEHTHLFFSYENEIVCLYVFPIEENEVLHSRVYDRLLPYCNEKIQDFKKEKIIQDFLDNN